MTNFAKYGLLTLIIALIISIGLNIFYWWSYHPTPTAAAKAQAIKTETNFIKKSTDSLKNVHYRFKEQEPISQVQASAPAQNPTWVDTVSKNLDLGTKYKEQVTELTRINATLSDSLLKAKVMLDTAKKKICYYQNKYVRLTFKHLLDTGDTGLFGYDVNANFTIANIRQRGWLGTYKRSLIDISSDDQHFTINNVNHYQVEPIVPEIQFHVQAGARYLWDARSFAPFGGVQLDLGKTYILGGYIYDFSRKNYDIYITAKRDLLTF